MIWYGTVSITTVGEAGSATGSGKLVAPAGKLLALKFDHHADAAATTDVTVTHPTLGTIMAKTDSKTDAMFYPAVQLTGADGAAIAGAYERVYVSGELTISIAQGDALTAALVASAWVLTD